MRGFAGGMLLVVFGLALTAVGCSSYKKGGAEARTSLESEANTALANFQTADPTLKRFFDSSYGYCIFPKITKGAAGIGFAHGEGVVTEKNQAIGYATVSQGSIGAQLGGQSYSEIIFFQDKPTLDLFKFGNMEFSAQVSAVAASSGAAAQSDFDSGVAVFTLARSGLMFDASVGGQKFAYTPKTQ